MKRHIIPASPLTEKITFEDVPLPELELSDEERVAFLAAFDDERGFRADVATRRREAQIVESEHFSTPRRFGFGPNPESETTRQRFAAFRSLKPVFVVALDTGLRKSDLLNLQWEQVDLANGFIRLLMKKHIVKDDGTLRAGGRRGSCGSKTRVGRAKLTVGLTSAAPQQGHS